MIASVEERSNDGALIEASKQEPDKFALIFDRHHLAIHRYVRRRVGSSLADDLTAETFCTALREREKYDPRFQDARPWLFGIATNLVRRHHRTEARKLRAYARTGVDPVFDESEEADSRVDASRLGPAMAEALVTLSPGDREVLLLYAWAELSYEEIAEGLMIPIGTVRSRLSRARAQLRKLIPEESSARQWSKEQSSA